MAETNAVPAAVSQPVESITPWLNLALQSVQQLNEQQHETLQAVEQARKDAEAEAKRNAEAVEARLNRIEQAVAAQRERELDSLETSHRQTLMIVGVFAGLAFFGMLFVALMLLRAMNRRVELAVPQFAGAPLGQGQFAPALGAGDTGLAPLSPAAQSSARLAHALEQLEKRLNELEDTSESGSAPAEDDRAARPTPPVGDKAARVALLIGKGQSLLALQQADGAVECFDEVIALDPSYADAFVKKGSALERLGRIDEAIDNYDRAIALDDSLTMAYLCKGGVFNRQERYGEALQCYEQALHAQEKTRVR